jgi:hypothetical protein
VTAGVETVELGRVHAGGERGESRYVGLGRKFVFSQLSYSIWMEKKMEWH